MTVIGKQWAIKGPGLFTLTAQNSVARRHGREVNCDLGKESVVELLVLLLMS